MRQPFLLALRRASVVCVLLSAAALVGCTSLGSVAPPDLAITDLSIVELTALETTARLTVRLTNPNPEPLHLTGGSFSLRLQGVKVGTAVSNREVQLDRLSTVTQEIDVNINHLMVLTRLRPILQANNVQYDLRGKLYTPSPFGTKTIKVGSSGSVDLPESWGSSLDSLAPVSASPPP